MANPAVEKVKNFGIRHGEKVGVALIAALCLFFVVMAWSREAVDVTPDQIDKSAKSAQQNINRPQNIEDIKQRLDEEGLIPPPLVEQVKLAQQEQKSGETKLAFAGPPFTFPEPGAGLIRETPTLIAPEDLYVTAGRGALRVLKTDEQGNLVYVDPTKDAEAAKKQASTRSRQGGMSARMMSAMMGYGGMPGGGGQQLTEEERKKQEEAERKRLAQMLAGTPRGEVAKEIGEKTQSGLIPEEINYGYRWVSIVGKLDHEKMREEFSRALKAPDAQPHYLRLDVQRRELRSLDDEDDWGEWTDVDREYNQQVLAYVASKDDELAPADVLLDGLVDMLPFLQVGAYKGVHYGPLVEAAKIAPATPPPGMMGRRGMMGGMSGGMDGGAMMASAMGYNSMMDGMDSGAMMSGMGGGSGAMMGYGMMGGGGMAQANFPKSSAAELMIRSLDFTVVPDTAYEYRVRLVVANPNKGIDNVKPGTDTQSEELYGPWSETTAPVRVPADVTTYAMGPSLTDPNTLRFQVASFDEKTGLTVVDNFDQKPGQMIGEGRYVPVPKEDGKGVKRDQINFGSKQLLVDGYVLKRPLELIGKPGSTFTAPALAVVMRPDGLLVVRDETRDRHDPEMRQMEEVYREILKDAEEGGREPKNSMTNMYSAMYGGGEAF